MQTLIALTDGAPAAALILAAMLVASLFVLYRRPELLDRYLFRPYWFWPRQQFATPLTSAFLHADLPHLAFNAFTFWAFAFSLEQRARELGVLRVSGFLPREAGRLFLGEAAGLAALGAVA